MFSYFILHPLLSFHCVALRRVWFHLTYKLPFRNGRNGRLTRSLLQAFPLQSKQMHFLQHQVLQILNHLSNLLMALL